MKVTVSVTERVNLGNYEYVGVTAGVEFDDSETDGVPAAEFAAEQLDVLMDSHRRRALDLLPQTGESFMLYHPALEDQ